MKKFKILFLIIIFLAGFSNSTCKASNISDIKYTEDPQWIEASEYIMSNIYTSSMNFKGANSNWDATLLVENTVTETGKTKSNLKLTLVPQKSEVEWINCSIITNNGIATKNVWHIFTKTIVITTDYPTPRVDEDVVLLIKSKDCSTLDVLVLKNEIPEGMISAATAIKYMMVEYYNIYGTIPPETYTYKIFLYDDDWLISYNDNDGIGGEAHVLVDGKTGSINGIKIEE